MDTIFMNSKNNKTYDSHRLLRNLPEYMLLYQIFYYALNNIKMSYKNNTFKASAETWNENFQLPDGSYSVLDIPEYFKFIIEKYQKLADNPPIRIFVNKIKNRIIFKIKAGYYL